MPRLRCPLPRSQPFKPHPPGKAWPAGCIHPETANFFSHSTFFLRTQSLFRMNLKTPFLNLLASLILGGSVLLVALRQPAGPPAEQEVHTDYCIISASSREIFVNHADGRRRVIEVKMKDGAQSREIAQLILELEKEGYEFVSHANGEGTIREIILAK